jgi:dihydrofolate reductase
MRKIITTTFITLDGVMQAPGGPEEDRTGGFTHGGWMANYRDAVGSSVIDTWMGLPFDLLLGKRTYDIFAGYWPHTKQAPTIAIPFNSSRKYVVSHKPATLLWQNSTLITGDDVVAQIKKLKAENSPDVWVWGSGNLIQTLLKHHLIDRMHLWIFPITLGSGKRLFAEGVQAEGFKLTNSKITTTGVIIATYELVGKLKTGP